MAMRTELADPSNVGDFVPSTRYRGSKRRHLPEIMDAMHRSSPARVWDAFGGSGVVAAGCDLIGVPAHYTDIYDWVVACSKAALHNEYSKEDLQWALDEVTAVCENEDPGFIQQTFSDCYFLDGENLELDGLLSLYLDNKGEPRGDLILYGVAQAALAKMPMSMFHRAALNQRIADVDRRNGNSTTWEKPFSTLVPRFIEEVVLFTWRRDLRHPVSKACALDAVPELDAGEALFLDPPYINPNGGVPTYQKAYHFLEGFSHGPERWRKDLDLRYTHPIYRGGQDSEFESAQGWLEGIGELVDRAQAGTVIATSRSRDRPGAAELESLLEDRFASVSKTTLSSSTVFSSKDNEEYLFVATG